MESVYDSVPLARAMLRGSFSDSSQASTAPIVPSKLSHVLSPSSPSSARAPSSDQCRLSFDSARSISPEWENTIPFPGIPLHEWIARENAKEEAARRRAEQEGSAEEEDEALDDGGSSYDPDRRSPGTPTVDDALMYFARPEAPPSRPPLGITLSASSAAVYGATHSAHLAKSPSSPSSHSAEASASGRLYHPPSSKPFKCPTEGCDKAYKQGNGLKYHLKHGQCSNDPELLAKEKDPLNAEKKRFACHSVAECGKKYKNLNGLRYHYLHSGAHGVLGLQLLKQGLHPAFPKGGKANSEEAESVKEKEEREGSELMNEEEGEK